MQFDQHRRNFRDSHTRGNNRADVQGEVDAIDTGQVPIVGKHALTNTSLLLGRQAYSTASLILPLTLLLLLVVTLPSLLLLVVSLLFVALPLLLVPLIVAVSRTLPCRPVGILRPTGLVSTLLLGAAVLLGVAIFVTLALTSGLISISPTSLAVLLSVAPLLLLSVAPLLSLLSVATLLPFLSVPTLLPFLSIATLLPFLAGVFSAFTSLASSTLALVSGRLALCAGLAAPVLLRRSGPTFVLLCGAATLPTTSLSARRVLCRRNDKTRQQCGCTCQHGISHSHKNSSHCDTARIPYCSGHSADMLAR